MLRLSGTTCVACTLLLLWDTHPQVQSLETKTSPCRQCLWTMICNVCCTGRRLGTMWGPLPSRAAAGPRNPSALLRSRYCVAATALPSAKSLHPAASYHVRREPLGGHFALTTWAVPHHVNTRVRAGSGGGGGGGSGRPPALGRRRRRLLRTRNGMKRRDDAPGMPTCLLVNHPHSRCAGTALGGSLAGLVSISARAKKPVRTTMVCWRVSVCLGTALLISFFRHFSHKPYLK